MGILSKIKEFISKDYQVGLSKSRDEFNTKLDTINKKHQKIDDEYYDDLEELLISFDLGVDLTTKIIERLKARFKKEATKDISLLNEIIVDELFVMYVDNQILTNKINFNLSGPTAILLVGVNGVGKTTTIAKLGYKFKSQGKKVMLIAADTFRAGAIEQLKVWGNRLDIDVISSLNTDPSSVIFDGLQKAITLKYDVILIDTAGRLQTKDNLMQELAKINRVINNIIPSAPHETLLVIDATTGQNGISQAQSFKEITNVTGIVLTKLDGTAKGGIVLSIKEKTKIPVKYIGLGEKKEDLHVFDVEKYIYNLIMKEE